MSVGIRRSDYCLLSWDAIESDIHHGFGDIFCLYLQGRKVNFHLPLGWRKHVVKPWECPCLYHR
jgi:hypothetical protein